MQTEPPLPARQGCFLVDVLTSGCTPEGYTVFCLLLGQNPAVQLFPWFFRNSPAGNRIGKEEREGEECTPKGKNPPMPGNSPTQVQL